MAAKVLKLMSLLDRVIVAEARSASVIQLRPSRGQSYEPCSMCNDTGFRLLSQYGRDQLIQCEHELVNDTGMH
jgi:hypothetical protein